MAEFFGGPNEKTWGIVLSKDNKTVVWPSESDVTDGTDMKLELSQATLGASAKTGERNVVELSIVTEFGAEETQTFPIVSLKEGLSEHTLLNLSLNPPVSFSLSSGNGPISIMGVQHNMVGDDSSGSEDDSDNEELVKKETAVTGKKRKFESPVSEAKKSKVESKPVLPVGKESIESAKDRIMKLMGKEDLDDDSDEDSNIDLDESLSDEEGKNGFSLDDESMSDASEEKKVKTAQPVVKKEKNKPVKGKPVSKPQQEQKVSPKGGKTGKLQTQSMEAVKAKLRANKSLPKSEEKFKNYIKTLKVSDGGQISELWKFVQSIRKP